MIRKKPIQPARVRTIQGSFTFIEHRFLRDGFLAALTHREIALYLFLSLAADKDGLLLLRLRQDLLDS